MSISQSRGLKEMGIATGSGLLAILLATFLFLPSLLVIRERRLEKKREKKKDTEPIAQRDISFRFLGHMAVWLNRHYVFTILFSLLLTLLLAWFGSEITFDQNYMNIEPKGLTSIELQDVVLEKFDMSMDYALILADDIDESRELARAYRELGSVAVTEDISLYLPSSEQQQNRIPHIVEIVEKVQATPVEEGVVWDGILKLHEEVERLEMNIMEMQDMAYLGGQDKVDDKCKSIVGDPEKPESQNIIKELLRLLEADQEQLLGGLSSFQERFAPYFKRSVIQMASTESIKLEDLPVSILDRYSNKTREQFLVTVFPQGNIWQDAEFLHRFDDDLERVSDKATGMPPVFRALIEIIGRDGRNAVFLTLIIVFLLLLVDFRSPVAALMAMIPLACGVVWMVGLMKLTGMQITVMNIMALPLIVGIGIDDGVHIVHRWRHEGKRNINTVFSSTGKAILLTSLTTMLAFGSLVFSIWRGFGHLGGALFIGVGACFLATVFILPGIIGFFARKSS
jgi:predicted RND superfamily exporter protein